MSLKILPGANTSRMYDNRYPGVVWPGGPDVILLHSTETRSLPGYSGGASAPNATFDIKGRRVYQHFSCNRSSRALVSGPISTNRSRVFQVELIAYSDRKIARSIGRDDLWVGNLTDSDLRWIAKQLAPLVKDYPIPFRLTPRFTRNPRYGTGAPQRMSAAEWRAFSGWTYHAAAPYNSHWDTGALDIPKIMYFCKQIVDGKEPPPPKPTPTPQKGQDWTVRPGNTLSWIAKHWGKSVDEIARYNNIKDPNKIKVGQVIRWPKSTPPPSSKFPTVGDNKVWPDYAAWGQGDSDSVRCIQHALIGKGHRIPAGATGFWGPQTIAATKSLIGGGNGLPGPKTVASILNGTPYRLQSGFGRSVRKWNGGKVYSGWTFYGNKGSDSVRNLQQRLIDLGHNIPAGPTGNYFGQTQNAVMSFQRSVGLRVDGIAGEKTLRALFVAPKQHYLIVWGK